MKRFRQRVTRLLRSSAVHQAKDNATGFFLGLFLAFVYGMTALLVQKHDLWYCLISTVTIAVFISFGMAFSSRVRANVMLMLPMLCSMHGKRFLLFLAFTAVMKGPMGNTLENFDRAADSVVCGTELVMNQTQQLMRRAAAPLLPVLKKIKAVTRNVYSMTGRVKKLFDALSESVRHVARTLRNVLHFLVTIGEVCNEKLGTPQKKCHKLFDEAHKDCMEQLSIFSFLCNIVEGFRPLCGLARAGQFFCIIPTYIVSHLKAKIADSTLAAFEQIKKEFEFNISASTHYDLQLNSSQSIQEMAQDMMEEVSEDLIYFQGLTGLLAYMSLVLLLFMYLQAVLYKNNYLQCDTFDNIYITDQFVEMDLRWSRQRQPAVLPLSQREARTYIRPRSLYLTAEERRTVAAGMLSVLKHLAMACVVIALDVMVFWVFDVVHHQAQGEIVARAPIIFEIQVNGSGYASDIFKDIVASFDVLQRGNITVLDKKCLMEPLEPDYTGYLVIGFLYGLATFTVITGGYIKRLRRFVCASYHPQRERERILLLRQRILSQRKSLGKALLRSVARGKEDGQHMSLLQTLSLYLPGGPAIARFLGVFDVSCMTCGKLMAGKDDPNVHVCSTSQCKGVYCSQCFRLMKNICAICMGPLTFQEDSEEELDSSDDERVILWTAALSSPHISQRRDMRKVMKRRISVATRGRGGQHCSLHSMRHAFHSQDRELYDPTALGPANQV
ncbi:DC-STAMP domain-containing protein 2 [Chanos chanos]|uniref:DC-STAMP domain-containing protein 2 n=1 Tax=Chanos chanos TaxID=29144 RepID=A0A6J2W6G2_CHACN|nr:DC-STAMP domain-containing protein 2 [Chanos chanos]